MCRCVDRARDALEAAAMGYAMTGTKRDEDRLRKAARDLYATVLADAGLPMDDLPTVVEVRPLSPLREPESGAA